MTRKSKSTLLKRKLEAEQAPEPVEVWKKPKVEHASIADKPKEATKPAAQTKAKKETAAKEAGYSQTGETEVVQVSKEAEEGEDGEEESQHPSEEEIKADTTLSEGARLALAYCALYLRFNPLPPSFLASTSSAPVAKSFRSRAPLPLDPYNNPNPFQSDFNPQGTEFVLSAQEYAQRKRDAKKGKAKKGDGKSGVRWQFNKARENFLLRHILNEKEIPEKYFPTALGYLRTLRSPAREITRKEAETASSAEGVKGVRAKALFEVLSDKKKTAAAEDSEDSKESTEEVDADAIEGEEEGDDDDGEEEDDEDEE